MFLAPFFLVFSLASTLPTSPSVHPAPPAPASSPPPGNYTNVVSDFINEPINEDVEFDTALVQAMEQSFLHLLPNADPKTGSGFTRNDLLDPKEPCKPLTVIFARGSTEPGNIGGHVGPALFWALSQIYPDMMTFQGVNNYTASVQDYFLGGSTTAAQYMAASVGLAAEQCPATNIVLAGYSQGAQVVHKAVRRIPKDLYHRVKAILLFGDPKNMYPLVNPFNDRLLRICHNGDNICQGIPWPTPEHSTYYVDAPDAARFVESRVGPLGTSGTPFAMLGFTSVTSGILLSIF